MNQTVWMGIGSTGVMSWALLAGFAADDDLANGQVMAWDLTNGACLSQSVWREAAIQDAAMVPSQGNPLLPAYFVSTAIKTSAIHIHSLTKVFRVHIT